ncbi:hypothetical protein F183_A32610 [Bryobacterales bacterium F-183]|nr:hypothetical protein F183_A32610 [Bryobacterales bacterium F-183]
MAKTAVIAGATGLVGSHLLPLLCEHYDQVAAFTRRPLSFSVPNLRELPFTDLHNSWGPTDDAYCCLGITIAKAGSKEAFLAVDHDLVIDFAKAARTNGARQFAVVSSVDASHSCPLFYLKVKAKMEDAVSHLGYDSVHIAQPSFLLGQRDQARTMEQLGIVVAKAIGPLLIGPLSRYRAITAHDVAAAMLEAAKQGKPGVHRMLYRDLMNNVA